MEWTRIGNRSNHSQIPSRSHHRHITILTGCLVYQAGTFRILIHRCWGWQKEKAYYHGPATDAAVRPMTFNKLTSITPMSTHSPSLGRVYSHDHVTFSCNRSHEWMRPLHRAARAVVNVYQATTVSPSCHLLIENSVTQLLYYQFFFWFFIPLW